MRIAVALAHRPSCVALFPLRSPTSHLALKTIEVCDFFSLEREKGETGPDAHGWLVHDLRRDRGGGSTCSGRAKLPRLVSPILAWRGRAQVCEC